MGEFNVGYVLCGLDSTANVIHWLAQQMYCICCADILLYPWVLYKGTVRYLDREVGKNCAQV